MKTILLVLAIVLAWTSLAREQSVLSIAIFSGEEDPRTAYEDADELKSIQLKIARLKTPAKELESRLGYRGLRFDWNGPQPCKFRVWNGTVELERDGKSVAFKDDQGLEYLLLHRALNSKWNQDLGLELKGILQSRLKELQPTL